MAFYTGFYAYAIIVQTQADQLLPQLLLEHIEHMHEGVWYRENNF